MDVQLYFIFYIFSLHFVKFSSCSQCSVPYSTVIFPLRLRDQYQYERFCQVAFFHGNLETLLSNFIDFTM